MTDEELKAIHSRILRPGEARDRPSTDRAALWVYVCELRAELASARTTIAFRSGEFGELRADNAALRKHAEDRVADVVVKQTALLHDKIDALETANARIRAERDEARAVALDLFDCDDHSPCWSEHETAAGSAIDRWLAEPPEASTAPAAKEIDHG